MEVPLKIWLSVPLIHRLVIWSPGARISVRFSGDQLISCESTVVLTDAVAVVGKAGKCVVASRRTDCTHGRFRGGGEHRYVHGVIASCYGDEHACFDQACHLTYCET